MKKIIKKIIPRFLSVTFERLPLQLPDQFAVIHVSLVLSRPTFYLSLHRRMYKGMQTCQSSIQKGFTLIELLVSLLIFTTIGSLVLGIVWVSIRSTVKVNNMNMIRQNGNFAVTQVAKMLQFAQQFQGVSNNGTTYVQTCQAPGTTPLQTYRYVRITAADSGTVVLGCLASPSTIASNSSSLINTASYSVTACSFTCTQATPNSPYSIGVQFTVQKNIAGNLFDQPAPVPFQTSATIRNFSR